MKRQTGFTLIELMIVVAVVGILAAIAYPSYQEYVRKARRADAMNALAEIRIEQEKWRANNTSFTTNLSAPPAGLGVGALSGGSYYSADEHYILEVTSAGTSTFTATAAPTGDQAGDSCGTFAVDREGIDDSGSYADRDCWSR
ncbi:type IV pilin protein [Marinobacterium lutimaris]|uniref:Type IV pilus assembly protein PilE n=1 Tax=Marinobacterium lutimaris TaxID=568106 RepID=A0A1H6CVS5_9GAMM|nr:type IV pilin protein [Marinobacterium lutimaris]SEG76948.1 type IV pilus assembly protein PilE [Marinobacterium lutimaris]